MPRARRDVYASRKHIKLCSSCTIKDLKLWLTGSKFFQSPLSDLYNNYVQMRDKTGDPTFAPAKIAPVRIPPVRKV